MNCFSDYHKEGMRDPVSLDLCHHLVFPLFSNSGKYIVISHGFNLNFLRANDIEPEKAMATHSSTLAWKTSWAEEPGRLQSMGSLRVGHD